MLKLVGEPGRTGGFVRGLGVLAALALIAALALLPASALGRGADQADVLILGPSVVGSTSVEQAQAEAAGLTVDVVSADNWKSKSTEDFAAYKAIVVGDPSCGTTDAF